MVKLWSKVGSCLLWLSSTLFPSFSSLLGASTGGLRIGYSTGSYGSRLSTLSNPSEEIKTSDLIRLASEKDLDFLLSVERSVIQDDYWSAQDFLYFFKVPEARIAVCLCQGLPVAYIAWISMPNGVRVVKSLVVLKSLQRKGIGRLLLASLQVTSPKLLLFVLRESNLENQNFLKACGFKCVSIVKSVFQNPPEDAYRFEWRPE